MCGFVGAWSPGLLPQELSDLSLQKRMLSTLTSRGPDDQRLVVGKDMFIGHSRLSILDVESSHQPMQINENEWLAFNGEIYNYLELKKLLFPSQEFKTNGDTEVLLKLISQFGVDGLSQLNGDFAFAYINRKKKQLILSRDRVGIKPLFYFVNKDVVLFASSIGALIPYKGLDASLDLMSLTQMCHLWTQSPSRSFVKDIKAINPGEYIVFGEHGLEIKKSYWELGFSDEPTKQSIEILKEELKFILNDAVKIRLRSDVEVGAYLSGGLDSTINLGIMSNMQESISSFSVRFEDSSFDESEYQSLVSNNFRLKNLYVNVNEKQIAESFCKTVEATEAPLFRTAPVPMLLLSDLVKKNGIKVVLTGEGADEIFWGYDLFKEARLREKISGREEIDISSHLVEMYPYMREFGSRYVKLMEQVYRETSVNVDDILFSHRNRIVNGKKFVAPILNVEMFQGLSAESWEEDFLKEVPKGVKEWNVLQRAQYFEMRTLMSEYLLSSQGDRVQMANSVEGRFPFLDHRVIEFAAMLPTEYKLNSNNEKFILKESYRDLVPRKIIDRPKNPYRSPEASSLVKSTIGDQYLSESSIKEFGVFDHERISRLVESARRGSGSFNENFCLIMVASTHVFLRRITSIRNVSSHNEEIKITRI